MLDESFPQALFLTESHQLSQRWSPDCDDTHCRETCGRARGRGPETRIQLRATFDKAIWELYKDHMKTLTITDAKKNLSRWLTAASRGEDIGIICGADIIALRKMEVESTDYAQREYVATPEQVAALEKATDRRYQRLKRSGKLVTVTAAQLRKMIG